jgi:hypothetical protein
MNDDKRALAVKGLQEIFSTDDVITEVPEKSIEEIIREVAEEEGLTEEEVAEAVEKLANMNFQVAGKKRDTKQKRDKSKEKAKKKQAKKSKRRNR